MKFPLCIFLLLPLAFISCDNKKKKGAKSSTPPAAHTPQAPAPAQTVWRLTELPGTWTLTGFAEDADLSGMAAWDIQHCLVCTDEKSNIQPGLIDRSAHTITAGAAFPLLPGAPKKTETDCEGVAVSHPDKCYYVTGSHGVAKKSGDLQPSRSHVFRIPVNAATGTPDTNAVQAGSLMPWLMQNPVLSPSINKDLQHDGFNIEGLTWKDGKLWFGVRAPNIGGEIFVIEAVPASLFTPTPVATLHRLQAGTGLGIREIAALKDGFLILTGESNSDTGPDKQFRLYRWTPGQPPEFVGPLPAAEGKAEGLYVLDETNGAVDVLVIYDSGPSGGPHAYRISKL